MAKGQKYSCSGCGLEIEVVKECEHEEEGSCDDCSFICCGEEMVLRK